MFITQTKWQLNDVQSKCTMVDEEIQRPSQEEPSGYLGFPVAPTIHLIYSHCLSILISLIQELTVNVLQECQNGKSGNKGSFLQKQNGLHPNMLQF